MTPCKIFISHCLLQSVVLWQCLFIQVTRPQVTSVSRDLSKQQPTGKSKLSDLICVEAVSSSTSIKKTLTTTVWSFKLIARGFGAGHETELWTKKHTRKPVLCSGLDWQISLLVDSVGYWSTELWGGGGSSLMTPTSEHSQHYIFAYHCSMNPHLSGYFQWSFYVIYNMAA